MDFFFFFFKAAVRDVDWPRATTQVNNAEGVDNQRQTGSNAGLLPLMLDRQRPLDIVCSETHWGATYASMLLWRSVSVITVRSDYMRMCDPIGSFIFVSTAYSFMALS